MLFAGQLIILRTNGFLAIVSFLFRVNAARRHEHMLREKAFLLVHASSPLLFINSRHNEKLSLTSRYCNYF